MRYHLINMDYSLRLKYAVMTENQQETNTLIKIGAVNIIKL